MSSDILHRNALSEPPPHPFDRLLLNPPFGTLPSPPRSPAPLRGGKQAELLFLDLTLHSLKLGGRGAIILPSGVLFRQGQAYRLLRQSLVDQFRLTTVVNLPPKTFQQPGGRGGSGVATHLFVFGNGGQTEIVHFYDLTDLSLDNCESWHTSRAEIVTSGYDLSPNRYRPLPDPEPPRPVADIWAELQALEAEIAHTNAELQHMLTDLL